MAYKLKYYKTIDDTRLNIYEKDGVAAAMEIGKVVQGLALEIQGQQDDITAPIVKTSLTMTFCDAPDLEEGKKCGHWEEFYTPDSTRWLVELLTINDDGSADVEWQGFITPDSYSDELVYRGSVTIIARDNIGHLSDFDFDATGNGAGMLTVKELLQEAWAKIEQPMGLTFDDRDDAVWLECEGVKIYDMMLNASVFEGKTWGDAVAVVLDSCGLCMRFVGLGKVAVCAVRSLPLLGYSRADAATKSYPTFLTGATRELDPACRRIEEVADYDVESGVSFPGVTGDDFTGEQYECPFDSENVFGEHTTTNIPVWPVANKSDVGWSNPMPTKTLFLNQAAYNMEIRSEGNMFLAVNTAEERHVQFGQYVTIQPMSLSLTLGRYFSRMESSLLWAWFVNGASFNVAVTFDQNDIQYYFDGSSWTTEYTTLTLKRQENIVQIDLNAGSLSGQGLLRIHILKITADWEWDVSNGEGMYIEVIGGITIGYSAAVVSKNSVRTIYDDSNNVIIYKAPELAPAMDDVSLPGIIRNGIFLPSGDTYLAARTWSWDGTGAQQLAVYKHLQLLPFHAKPNNLITGTIVDTTIRRIRTIWLFEDKEHLLLSGQFNILTGRLENAILREFARYENMWGDITDTASLPDVETSEATTGSRGVSSSGATTVTTTTVNIGGSGASNLADLGDVNVEDIEAGSVLMFNGTKWVDVKPEYATKADIQTVSDKIDQMWRLDSEGNVWTDRNVYSTKQIAAGGKASGEDGGTAETGVQAIQVGGTLYQPEDGIVTLPETAQGIESIGDAEDVDVADVQDGDTLVYNGDTGMFENRPSTYVHNQNTASAEWKIVHGMGKYPAVAVIDSAGTVVYGDITYNDQDTVTLTFAAAFSGKATLN